jgi:hypothetical protein
MQQKTVPITKGLHALVYDSAVDMSAPPTVRVSAEPDSSGSVILISEPGATDFVLERPGTCLVIRAIAPGQIRVEITPARRDGSTAATIKLHNISRASGTMAAASPPGEPAPPPGRASVAKPAPVPDKLGSRRGSKTRSLADLRLVAHMAGVGDVRAKAGEWVTTRPTGARIEGLAIEWRAKPDDVDIRYAVRIGGGNPGLTDLVTSGAFAGVRGRALPVVGLTMQLLGPGASNYRLTVEAMFEGLPIFHAVGEQVVLGGPTGQEPLVNLRLNLEKAVPEEKTKAARSTHAKRVKPRSGLKRAPRSVRRKPARARR